MFFVPNNEASGTNVFCTESEASGTREKIDFFEGKELS